MKLTGFHSARYFSALLAIFIFTVIFNATIFAQTTAFTYQGRLTDGAMAANGTYDFEFKLYDAANNQIGTGQVKEDVFVTNGVFSIQLDFGSTAFPGADRYLEISVKKPADSSYTILNPKQKLTSSPYAVRAVTAATADSLSDSCAGCINDSQINSVSGSKIAGTVENATNALNAMTATTATTANTAANFSGSLSGDVTGTQSATTVSTVGGISASNVASGVTAVNSATSSNTVNTIVKRDVDGNFSAGTITADLNGNAATATSAANFSGSLSGDVTGTQGTTTVATVGGTSAANVASGVTAANNAASNALPNTIVKRDSDGNFAAGTITAVLNGNALTATTATIANDVSTSAGNSIVTAINAGSSTINAARLPSTLATQNGTNTFSGVNTFSTAPTFSAGLSGGSQRITNVATPTVSTDAANKAYVDSAIGSGSFVQFAPSSQQTATTTNALINLKLIGADSLGNPNQTPLVSLWASGTYNGQMYDKERFRVNNDGGLLAVGELSPAVNSVPTEGAGTRFMWYPGKSAIRAGYVDGTQWDDANIGFYSVAFGHNARALGDWSVALGRNSAAPQSHAFALGHYTTASGYASVAMGEAAHTNSRQGSFVFADRSYTTICDTTMVEGSEYRPSGCTDTRVLSPWNNAFTVRASGGTHLYTNATRTTGLRLSGPSASGNGAAASDVLRHGSFVWTDRSSDTVVNPTAQNQTIFRSSGGYWLYSDSASTAGVTLAPGSGAWQNVSDRNMKDNFKAVNPREILKGVLNLPISTWNYKTQNSSIRHIGAMAQDFKAAFQVGEDDKHISTIDPDGVALAAIQGLNEEMNERTMKLQAENDALRHQVAAQKKQFDALEERLKKLEGSTPARRKTKRRK